VTLEKIFFTPLWNDRLNVSNLKFYKNFILELARTTPSEKKSNNGGWQSKSFSLDLAPPELLQLLVKINNYAVECALSIGNKNQNYTCYFWINVNKKNDYNTAHVHPGSILAGSFYISSPCPDAIIRFYNPNPIQNFLYSNIANDINTNPATCSRYDITPKEGQILVFPSWIFHKVYTNMSDEPRISIAFNICAE